MKLDKYVHFFASAWLFLAFMLFLDEPILAVIGALSIGLVKEIYDELLGKTGLSFSDIAVNIFGVFVSAALWLISTSF